MNDIVALKQSENKLELCCNCFLDGFDRLEYWPKNDPESSVEFKLEKDEIILSGLDEVAYVFCCHDADDNSTEELEINMVCKSDDEAVLIDAYKKLTPEIEESEAEILEDLIEDTIADLNNMNQYMNRSDGYDIRLVKEHIIRFICTDNDFIEECYMDIFVFKLGENRWKYVNRKMLAGDAEISLKEGLYKFKIFKDGYLVRQFFCMSDNEEKKDARFREKVNRLKELEENKRTSISLLPSDYRFGSDKEKEVLAALCSAGEEIKPFPSPILSYLDDIMFVSLGETYDFLKALADRKFYLSFVTLDEIYLKESIPIKVDIEARSFMFDTAKHFFAPTDYYFYIEDDIAERITSVGHIDLSETIYSDEETDIEDYNGKYNIILWNQYVRNLHSVFLEGNAGLWPEVRALLDRYPESYETEEKTVNDWLLENLVKNYTGGREAFSWILYYYYLCEFRYYRKIDRRFMKYQTSKPRYRTHIVPKGKYILAKTLISRNDKTVKREYSYSEEPVEFDVDDADYTVFYCIDPDNGYVSSDFGFYCYLGSNKFSYKFNSLEVEILNGL